METWTALARLVHVVTVVFMAWPLYALITVNERGALGPPLGDRADRYMENIIRGMTLRCFVFQVTALVTGVALVLLRGLGWSALVTNGVLLLKLILLAILMALLGYVHLSLQPRLDRLFAAATEGQITGELAPQIGRLRLRRKRIAGSCLFLVMTLVILGLQVYARFSVAISIFLITAAAAFARHAFRSKVPYGWL